MLLEAIELARRVVEIASDKQAQDIVLLDVRGIASFADFFILMSGETERHLSAIHDEINSALKKEGLKTCHREGDTDSGWLLADYGDVIVHIFAAAERQYYSLDELWSQAKAVMRVQ